MWYLLGDPPEFHVGEFADVHEDGHGDDSAGRRGRHAQVLVQVRVVTQNLDLEGQFVRGWAIYVRLLCISESFQEVWCTCLKGLKTLYLCISWCARVRSC